ncbi:MAG: hypothetical protein JOY54_20125 [Acidobacteriaceae bacterium]|nr:hypothetical protein [Acidobacteriaceae bacterium]
MNPLASPSLPPLSGSDLSSADKTVRLHTAAQQFEALMIGEMLKAAREGEGDGWLGDDQDSGSESAMDMAQSQFASALAGRGGLGLANMIEKAMSPHLAAVQNSAEKLETRSAASSQ